MANECIPYYDDGEEISAHVDVAVTGKTLVKINATRQSGPGLASTADGGNLRVAPASAAGKPFGVAARDAAVGQKVQILGSPGLVLPITAGGAITAGQEVEVGTGGKVVPFSSGIKVGLAVADATNNNDAQIKLY